MGDQFETGKAFYLQCVWGQYGSAENLYAVEVLFVQEGM